MFQTIESTATRAAAVAIGAETGLVAVVDSAPVLCSNLDTVQGAADCQFSTCSWLGDEGISDTTARQGDSVEQLIVAVNA